MAWLPLGGCPAPCLEAVVTRDSDFKKLVRQRMAATGQSYTAARAAMYQPAADVVLPLARRVFGLKTSYAAAFAGGRARGGIGAGEYLFRPLVAWGRSANVFLENGARLCLRPEESGLAQPAYATPECDSIVELAATSFADESRYRRLKITGAGPGLSQLATFVRVGATEQVLRLAESSVEVSVDHRGYTGPAGAVRTQRAYLAAARRLRRRPEDDIILDAWQAALDSHQDSQEPAPGSSD